MHNKLRNVLSEMATDLKSHNYDDRISFRFLYEKLLSRILYYIRIEARSLEITKDLNKWYHDCMDLESVSFTECGIILGCDSLKRTVKKLPNIVSSNYGLMLIANTIDNKTKVQIIQPQSLEDNLYRRFSKNNIFGWVQDNYLYIPNTLLNKVQVYLLPIGAVSNNECDSMLDKFLPYPDYIINISKLDVLQSLLGSYKQIVEDEKGDDNSNIKN